MEARSCLRGNRESSAASPRAITPKSSRSALALKDVRLALSEVGPDRFPVLAALAAEWTAIVDQGLGQEDVTVVTQALAG